MSRRAALGLAVLLATLGAVALAVVARGRGGGASCGPGFVARGARCCAAPDGPCGIASGTCPAPLVAGAGGCVGPARRVRVPAGEVVVGPSDWEAEGRVPPRRVRVAAFELDAFEAQAHEVACPTCATARAAGDPARAASGLSLAEARAFCAGRGGRLPTDDEWLVAAAGTRPRRYPWGDTGAVCRRAAWGLVEGPCAVSADGPDTVGAHPDGDTDLGLHDLAGNVAEWVEVPGEGAGRLRGGSYATSLATELRTWSSRDVGPGARPEAGVRCAYDAP